MALFGALLFCLINFLLIINTIDGQSATQLYTGCKNLENGVQWIRPIAGNKDSGEEYPNIQVRCADGWTILDYSLDTYISQYFTSFSSWTEYAASSSLDDRVTWSDWFLPATDNTKFAVAEDCSSCSSSSKQKDYATYFMTGNYIGCLWITKGMCDMDSSTLECYECETTQGKQYSGLCTHIEKSADTEVYVDHDLCTTNNFNLIPSIGTNGQYCVCYQQEEEVLVDAGSSYEREETTVVSGSASSTYEVYADEFTDGTYRITSPGYYKLMEDVELNMNAPDNLDSPNAEGAWYPLSTQSENYEGADDSFVGAFSMGFFAAFTIECDDVTIDLNGYEMKMNKNFYLQQRWFSIIEIGSKAFISGQGPGNFGAFLSSSNNVVIKNGVLGLTSHHSIHGNGATQITIEDMTIRDFEVAGIALNGFQNVIIQNVEVGPSFKEVPVLGVYTQARIMLPRLRKVIEENPDDTVSFYARSENKVMSMADIKDQLEEQMDAIFAHVIQGKEFDDDDVVWQHAKELFLNENNIPSASTVYGIFLNSLGASVFAVGGAPGFSYNAVVKNVKIHNLINDPWEVPRLMNVKGPFNDIVDVTRVTDNGMTDLATVQYQGSAYTDAQYALHELSESWSVLSHSALTDDVISWISTGQSLDDTSAKLQCNNDIMLHVTKGIFGLRIDSVDTFEIDNLEIEDLQNIGYYGSLVCGDYSSETDGGHRNQRAPMQYGYTGTEVHALSVINSKGTIDNVSIRRIISARGDAAGLRLYPGNTLTLGTISISDVHAGAFSKTTDNRLSDEAHLPNKLPRACGIDHWTYYDEEDDTLNLNAITYDESKISVSCITYMAGCSWDYSQELTSNSDEKCSKENGNLFNTEDIATVDSVYHAIEASNNDFYDDIITKLQAQIVLNEDENEESASSQKSTPQVPIWVYVVIAFIGFAVMLVMIFRKCYKPKKTAIFTSGQRVDMRNYNTMNNEKLPLLSQQL